MKISARNEQLSRMKVVLYDASHLLGHSILTLIVVVITAWCNTSWASNKPWCASDGGDWNCVPFEYGDWVYKASYGPYHSAGGGFSTPTDAYNALMSITAKRMTAAKCTYTVSALSAFTSASAQYQYATVSLSYGGSTCGYGTGSPTGYVVGIRQRWCPEGTQNYGYCVATANYKIEIQGNNTGTEPWNKKRDPSHNQANLAYTAIVTDQNGRPKANISVKIVSDATQDSGGHVHTSGRPKGKLIAGTSASISTRDGTATLPGTTDADGKFPFVFGAEEASGEHKITATCTECKAPAKATVKVAIEGLTLLGVEPQSYELVGSKEPHPHPGNHYFSEAAVVKIINLAHVYKKKFGELLIINDSSLIKGGVFDLGQDWTYEFSGHAGHRAGVVVDTNNYRDKRSTDFEKLASNSGIDAQWHTKGTAPHYHILLLGTGRDE